MFIRRRYPFVKEAKCHQYKNEGVRIIRFASANRKRKCERRFYLQICLPCTRRNIKKNEQCPPEIGAFCRTGSHLFLVMDLNYNLQYFATTLTDTLFGVL